MKQNDPKKRRQRWIAAGLAAVLAASFLLPVLVFAADTEDGAIDRKSVV